MTLPRWFEDFRHTKAYDIVIALPLIAWFARGGWLDAQNIAVYLKQIREGVQVSVAVLQIMATVASVLFCGLLVVMLLVRTVPRARASGMLPRILAVTGTFLGTGFLYLKPVPLPLPLGIAMIVVLAVTAAIEIYVLAWLGRSFAIMAEARKLVTGGPYRFVRHPLYVAETVGMAAVMVQFFGVPALALSLAYAAAQVGRALCEEKILADTFPEYGAYAARTARFIPGIY